MAERTTISIVEGIQRGIADMKAGRVTPHQEVMDRIDAVIAAASEKHVR